MKKEDVKVTVDQGMITIEGERKQEKEDKTEKYHRIESFHGSFSRSFSLPENVNVDGIRCESKDGVLVVHIPKTKAEAGGDRVPHPGSGAACAFGSAPGTVTSLTSRGRFEPPAKLDDSHRSVSDELILGGGVVHERARLCSICWLMSPPIAAI